MPRGPDANLSLTHTHTHTHKRAASCPSALCQDVPIADLQGPAVNTTLNTGAGPSRNTHTHTSLGQPWT